MSHRSLTIKLPGLDSSFYVFYFSFFLVKDCWNSVSWIPSAVPEGYRNNKGLYHVKTDILAQRHPIALSFTFIVIFMSWSIIWTKKDSEMLLSFSSSVPCMHFLFCICFLHGHSGRVHKWLCWQEHHSVSILFCFFRHYLSFTCRWLKDVVSNDQVKAA